MTGWSLTIAMKKSKFTEAQIVFALQQAESGVTVAEVCRKLGISEATFYNWKKKYSGLGPVELDNTRATVRSAIFGFAIASSEPAKWGRLELRNKQIATTLSRSLMALNADALCEHNIVSPTGSLSI